MPQSKSERLYQQYRQVFRQEVFGTDFKFLGQNLLQVFSNPRDFPVAGTTNNQATFVEELQFQGHSRDNRLNWQAGLYYEASDPVGLSNIRSPAFMFCQNVDASICAALPGPLAAASSLGDNNSSLMWRNLAAYGEGTYNLTQKLSLTTGFRYTFDTNEGRSYLVRYRFAPFPAFGPPVSADCTLNTPAVTVTSLAQNCFVFVRKTSTRPTWRVILKYDVTPDANVYASYARGYRQGGVNPQGGVGFQTFDSETVDTYEVGGKAAFRGKLRGNFNIAAFYSYFRDQQLQVGLTSTSGGGTTTGILNAGKSHMYGIEVETTLIPIDWFRLDASYGWLYSELDKQTLPPSGTPPFELILPTAGQGGLLPYSIRHKGSVTGTFKLPIPESYGDLSFSTTYTYASPYSTAVDLSGIPNPLLKLDATNLVNFNVNWNSLFGGPLDASFFMTNAFNDTAITYVAGTLNQLGYETGAMNEPRMYGFKLRLRFGSESSK